VAHASALHEPASPVVGVRHASGSCLGEGLHGFCGMVFGKGLRYYPSLPVAFSDWRAAPRQEPELRLTLENVHTPTMTLKNAALLALIGTILMTALLVWTFVFNFLNVLRGLVPAAMLFSSLLYAFGCFSVAVFFYVFHRAQSL